MTAVSNFPEDESQRVDIRTAVRVKLVCLQRVFQHFRRQVAHCADATVWRYVDRISLYIMSYSQSCPTESRKEFQDSGSLQHKLLTKLRCIHIHAGRQTVEKGWYGIGCNSTYFNGGVLIPSQHVCECIITVLCLSYLKNKPNTTKADIH